MKTKPFAIIAIASGNAKHLENFAMAEQIRQILVQEQDHQIDLATALGEEFQTLPVVRKDAPWASAGSAVRIAR
jgi:hypothetical protein